MDHRQIPVGGQQAPQGGFPPAVASGGDDQAGVLPHQQAAPLPVGLPGYQHHLVHQGMVQKGADGVDDDRASPQQLHYLVPRPRTAGWLPAAQVTAETRILSTKGLCPPLPPRFGAAVVCSLYHLLVQKKRMGWGDPVTGL